MIQRRGYQSTRKKTKKRSQLKLLRELSPNDNSDIDITQLRVEKSSVRKAAVSLIDLHKIFSYLFIQLF